MMNPKKKKCSVRGCKNTFYPRSSLQKACSWRCSLILVELAKKNKATALRKESRARREQIQPRSFFIKKAQVAFNLFVRTRDKDLPCISCQRHHTGQYHAGHYLTTGARPELRFHPSNNNKQCSACNNYLSGNLVLYRKNLIEKIGIEMVEYLENFNSPQKWAVEELKEIEQHYKKELKYLKQQNTA